MQTSVCCTSAERAQESADSEAGTESHARSGSPQDFEQVLEKFERALALTAREEAALLEALLQKLPCEGRWKSIVLAYNRLSGQARSL